MPRVRQARNPRSDLQSLRSRLAEAEETLAAIRAGAVDAIAVDGPAGRQIFTLQSAEQPYRILAEQMNEGAASIGADGTILFCNQRLATMVGQPAEKLVGSPAIELAAASERKGFQQLLLRARKGEARGEVGFQTPGGATVPVLASVKMIAGPTPGLCLVATDVHELKRAEHDLRLSQEVANRLAAIVTWSNDAIIGKTLDGIVSSWNPGAEAVYGYSAEEMIGKFMTITILPDRIAEFQEIMQRVGRGENVRHFECQRLRKDGKIIDVSLSISPVKDNNGKIVGASTIARDITERKHAEEELRRASLYTRNLIEASLDPLVTIDKDGRITDVNEATEKATGVMRTRLIGSDFSNYFTVPEKADQGYRRVFAAGFVRDYPLAIRHASGKVMDVLYNASLLKNEKGEVEGVFAAARDITGRKRAEEALQESEERFRTLANLVPQLVWMCQPDGLNIYFNQRWFDYTGLTPEQSYGRNWSTPFHTDDQQAAWDAWNHAVTTGDLYRIESRLRSADGSYRWFLMRGVPLRDKAGAIVKWFGTCTDIDDLKKAEAEIRTLNRDLEKRVEVRTSELRESESRIRRKLDTILCPEGDLADLEVSDILDIAAVQTLADDFYKLTNIPLFMVDLKGKILVGGGWQEICTKFHRVHPETCKNCVESDLVLSTGVKPGEFKLYKCKNNMWDAVTPLMLGEKHLANIFTGQFFFSDEPIDQELFRAQARTYGFDEQAYMAALARVPRLDREQVETSRAFFTKFAQLLSQLSYSGIKLARVMEETRNANIQLTASNKELEAFTYSVSHDLRAPLRHISGFSKILTEEFGQQLPVDARHHLQRIEEGTRRMGMLVDDLLNLARVGRRDISLQVTGLSSIADEAIAGLKPDIGERQVEWRVGKLPYVECDPALMKQVFQNLLANSLKFTRPREKAIIEIGQTQKDDAVVVYVRDNGVGFSMKYADKLFGVFQRLHRSEDFEGTGVGLATVQRIIQKHGGRIWAEAELDKGATFYFTIGGTEINEVKTNAAVSGVTT